MGRFSRILAAAVVIAAAAVVIVATAVVAVAAALTVVAAAAEQQKQDDDPAEIATTETIVTHNEYLQKFFRGNYRSFHGIPSAKKCDYAQRWASQKGKGGIHTGNNYRCFSGDGMFPLQCMGAQQLRYDGKLLGICIGFRCVILGIA